VVRPQRHLRGEEKRRTSGRGGKCECAKKEQPHLRAVVLKVEVLPLRGAVAIGYQLARRLWRVVSQKLMSHIKLKSKNTLSSRRVVGQLAHQ
jgi:hypothetical protein